VNKKNKHQDTDVNGSIEQQEKSDYPNEITNQFAE